MALTVPAFSWWLSLPKAFLSFVPDHLKGQRCLLSSAKQRQLLSWHQNIMLEADSGGCQGGKATRIVPQGGCSTFRPLMDLRL